MIAPDQKPWLAGVDGCAGGWLVAFVRPAGDEVHVRFVPRFAEILDAPERPAIVAVDMPIGLPDRSPPKGRLPEAAIRPLLGKRRSSVFRVPSREAVYAGASSHPVDTRERYFHACEIARGTSDDRKAFAKQAFFVFPKIVEVDQFLRANKSLIGRVFEVHPELAFCRLNNGPLDTTKKSPLGLAKRRELLIAAHIPESAVNSIPPQQAADDDLLDALVCATVARKIQAHKAHPFPKCPQNDACDIPMAIWA